MRRSFKVLVVGAGAGGLCLAQGLKREGIEVEVFERDPSPERQPQGYRLSISATGSRALNACLPAETFAMLKQAAAEPSTAVSILDHRLRRLLVLALPHRSRDALEAERPVSRGVLRRNLLHGLNDVVQFGKTFAGFAPAPGGGVEAHFADGSTAIGDVLVGADGANSRVRAALLPGAGRRDTGLVGVGGKLPLSNDLRAWVPPAILEGPTPILGPPGRFMFASAVQYNDLGWADPSAADREEYVMWGFSARRAKFGFASADLALTGETLKSAVARLTSDWHPRLQRLVAGTDPSTVHMFAIKTSVPVQPWKTGAVTLLGDALHNMPPFRGVGANSALWDAARLRAALVEAARGEAPLLDALGRYEQAMIEHGFRAVRRSLNDMRRFHAEGWIERALTRAILRALDCAPGLGALATGGR